LPRYGADGERIDVAMNFKEQGFRPISIDDQGRVDGGQRRSFKSHIDHCP
jgi:hypothetical protein